jgi:hypothetical protein
MTHARRSHLRRTHPDLVLGAQVSASKHRAGHAGQAGDCTDSSAYHRDDPAAAQPIAVTSSAAASVSRPATAMAQQCTPPQTQPTQTQTQTLSISTAVGHAGSPAAPSHQRSSPAHCSATHCAQSSETSSGAAAAPNLVDKLSLTTAAPRTRAASTFPPATPAHEGGGSGPGKGAGGSQPRAGPENVRSDLEPWGSRHSSQKF